MLLIVTSTAMGVTTLSKGEPFIPPEDGLYFTEKEARMEYQQKHTALEKVDYLEGLVMSQDEMIEALRDEFSEYRSADEKIGKAYETKITGLERQNRILWIAIIGLSAAVALD